MENKQKFGSLKNWSKEEKLLLMRNLKRYGSRNISLFVFEISGKSKEDIKAAIQYYKEKANLTSEPKIEEKRHKNKQIPHGSWANFLLDWYKFEDLQTETSTALKLIADLEERSPSNCTDQIDFSKIYLLVAEAMEGKPLTCNDKHTMAFLTKIITETAITSKEMLKNPVYKNIIQSIKMTDRDNCTFVKPADNIASALIRDLVKCTNYNPFHLTDENLKTLAHKSDSNRA